MAIKNRTGQDLWFDPNKMLPGEMAVSTDAKRVYVAFAPGDAREVAFKDQIPIVGDVTPDKLQEAVNNYLNENPVHAGATEEEVKQIELNRQNIEANDEAIKEVGKEVEKTNTNVAQLSNPNLFINGNFQIWSNGEEFTVKINDDGTYGGYVVTADRWTVGAWGSNTAYVYRTDKGLTFAREQAEPIDVFQVLEEETLKSILGKPLTMSYAIEDTTGVYQEYTRNVVLEENIEIKPFALAQEHFCIELQTGCTLIWVKLEVGTVQTPCVPDSKDAIICKMEQAMNTQPIALCSGVNTGDVYIKHNIDDISKYKMLFLCAMVSGTRRIIASTVIFPNYIVFGGSTWYNARYYKTDETYTAYCYFENNTTCYIRTDNNINVGYGLFGVK